MLGSLRADEKSVLETTRVTISLLGRVSGKGYTHSTRPMVGGWCGSKMEESMLDELRSGIRELAVKFEELRGYL